MVFVIIYVIVIFFQGRVNELTRKIEGPAQHQRSPDRPLLNKSGSSPQQVFPTSGGSLFGQDSSGPSPFRQDHSVNPFGGVQDRSSEAVVEPTSKKGRNTPSPSNGDEPRNFTPVNDEPMDDEGTKYSSLD